MNWIQALKAWNEKKGGKYSIPRKGTTEYDEVRALMTPKVEMPAKEYAAEHKRLINVLEKGTAKERKAEASKQKKEVKETLPRPKKTFDAAALQKRLGREEYRDARKDILGMM